MKRFLDTFGCGHILLALFLALPLDASTAPEPQQAIHTGTQEGLVAPDEVQHSYRTFVILRCQVKKRTHDGFVWLRFIWLVPTAYNLQETLNFILHEHLKAQTWWSNQSVILVQFQCQGKRGDASPDLFTFYTGTRGDITQGFQNRLRRDVARYRHLNDLPNHTFTLEELKRQLHETMGDLLRLDEIPELYKQHRMLQLLSLLQQDQFQRAAIVQRGQGFAFTSLKDIGIEGVAFSASQALTAQQCIPEQTAPLQEEEGSTNLGMGGAAAGGVVVSSMVFLGLQLAFSSKSSQADRQPQARAETSQEGASPTKGSTSSTSSTSGEIS